MGIARQTVGHVAGRPAAGDPDVEVEGLGAGEEAVAQGTDAARLGLQGAMVQMISHGFVSGALFLCVGVIYDRLHTRQIADYGGVINRMPKFAALFLLFSMANAGLPATSGFVGEFLVILGAVQFDFWIGFLAATALIWGATYSLWMYKRVVFGAVANPHVEEMEDVNRREFWLLMLMAAFVLFMGLYPKFFTDLIQVSVENLLQHLSHTKLK